MLELVILESVRDAWASVFRRVAMCCWATGPRDLQATMGGQSRGTALLPYPT